MKAVMKAEMEAEMGQKCSGRELEMKAKMELMMRRAAEMLVHAPGFGNLDMV